MLRARRGVAGDASAVGALRADGTQRQDGQLHPGARHSHHGARGGHDQELGGVAPGAGLHAAASGRRLSADAESEGGRLRGAGGVHQGRDAGVRGAVLDQDRVQLQRLATRAQPVRRAHARRQGGGRAQQHVLGCHDWPDLLHRIRHVRAGHVVRGSNRGHGPRQRRRRDLGVLLRAYRRLQPWACSADVQELCGGADGGGARAVADQPAVEDRPAERGGAAAEGVQGQHRAGERALLLPVAAGAGGAAGAEHAHRGGHVDGHRGPLGLGQVDGDQSAGALLRPAAGQRARGRARPAAAQPALAARQHRPGEPGAGALLHQHRGQHPHGRPERHAGAGGGGGARGQRARVHLGAARGVQHAGGREGRAAERRAEAARGHRARHAAQPAHPAAGRGHVWRASSTCRRRWTR
eukprot:scaffold2162_cov398-Prasinococcus_capsulatus_cf.AAC.27